MSALGAEVRLTCLTTRGHRLPGRGCAPGRRNSGAFYVNHPATLHPLAHERTTGPEIWEQMRHDVNAIVCGVGSGECVAGLGRFLISNRVAD
jgi:cystathionine beta-synthase